MFLSKRWIPKLATMINYRQVSVMVMFSLLFSFAHYASPALADSTGFRHYGMETETNSGYVWRGLGPSEGGIQHNAGLFVLNREAFVDRPHFVRHLDSPSRHCPLTP